MGPFLRLKEQDSQASSGDGPKWCKMVQLWDQLCVREGVLYRMADFTPECFSACSAQITVRGSVV